VAKLLMKWFQVMMLVSSLVFAANSWSDDVEGKGTQRPGFAAILGDVVFVRPLTLVATAVGSVIFVAFLPVTLATGTVGEAGMSLVVDPAATTFVRCLGCTEDGWRKLPPKALSDQ